MSAWPPGPLDRACGPPPAESPRGAAAAPARIRGTRDTWGAAQSSSTAGPMRSGSARGSSGACRRCPRSAWLHQPAASPRCIWRTRRRNPAVGLGRVGRPRSPKSSTTRRPPPRCRIARQPLELMPRGRPSAGGPRGFRRQTRSRSCRRKCSGRSRTSGAGRPWALCTRSPCSPCSRDLGGCKIWAGTASPPPKCSGSHRRHRTVLV
mmetsp:Transcript_53309/g.159024  ORF Transcript_53309/g.159024 Transcript_53309/m.159024 type:complete len:207 (-) Transcript_53309:103-723(-)